MHGHVIGIILLTYLQRFVLYKPGLLTRTNWRLAQ
jgi:hypothetical protein